MGHFRVWNLRHSSWADAQFEPSYLRTLREAQDEPELQGPGRKFTCLKEMAGKQARGKCKINVASLTGG